VALDLLFVVVFHWGVAGVAVATMLSQTVSAVLVWVTLTKTSRIYRLHPRRIRFDLPILRDIIRIGIPAGLQSVMYSLSNLVVQASINSFGTDTIAAWTAYGKIDGIFWMIMGAFGVSITTFAGQNFGAKKYDRLRQSVRVCTAMAMGTALFMGALVVLAGPYIYRLFTTDAAVVDIGMAMVRIISPFYFTYVLVEVLSGATRGAGDSLMPMLMTCLGACILRIVWVQVAVPLVHEVRTVCLAYPITWTATSILFLIYYLKGGWLKRRIAKAEAAEASLEQTPQP
jgi:putative MATE family efflux protein